MERKLAKELQLQIKTCPKTQDVFREIYVRIKTRRLEEAISNLEAEKKAWSEVPRDKFFQTLCGTTKLTNTQISKILETWDDASKRELEVRMRECKPLRKTATTVVEQFLIGLKNVSGAFV